MSRRRRTRDLTKRQPPRRYPKRADELKKGDILWSALSGRLFVLDAFPTQVKASGNLLASVEAGPWKDEEDEEQLMTTAIVIVAKRQRDGKILQLGAYAPRAKLDTVKSADL